MTAYDLALHNAPTARGSVPLACTDTTGLHVTDYIQERWRPDLVDVISRKVPDELSYEDAYEALLTVMEQAGIVEYGSCNPGLIDADDALEGDKCFRCGSPLREVELDELRDTP